MKPVQHLLVAFFVLTSQFSYAGSATWKSSPPSDDWNTTTNWTPATVPNGPADFATFATSSRTDVSIADDIEVSEMNFNAGATAYTFTVSPIYDLTISGAGIVNDSGVIQNFVAETDLLYGYKSDIIFSNTATAGRNAVFTCLGGGEEASIGGTVHFMDSSSADHATFKIFDGRDDRAYGAEVIIDTNATAGDATFVVYDGTSVGFSGTLSISGTAENAHITNEGGETIFFGRGGNSQITNRTGYTSFSSSANAEHATIVNKGGRFAGDYSYGSTNFTYSASGGNAVITSEGGNGEGTYGGQTFFSGYYGVTTAGDATFIAQGGVNGGGGGTIRFYEGTVDGGTASFELSGNGNLDITDLESDLTIGSLKGDGPVFLGVNSLAIGSNNRSTIYAGVIQGLGGLTKLGTGTLTLSNASSYTGGTVVSNGTLAVTNPFGSAVGPGLLRVEVGGLRGTGFIVGDVTIGTGAGSGATLSPGIGHVLGTLTMQNHVTMKTDSTYQFVLNSSSAKGATLSARGVVIDNGALFAGSDQKTATLAVGTTFTVIKNTALHKPISGAFGNLADGSVTRIGRNNFQASYTGGDGNDLTLTVVP